jgi:hypothetical protein
MPNVPCGQQSVQQVTSSVAYTVQASTNIEETNRATTGRERFPACAGGRAGAEVA